MSPTCLVAMAVLLSGPTALVVADDPDCVETPAARQPAADTADAQPPTPPPHEDDPDEDLNLAQPDFTIATLPTTLRLPRHRTAFRVTHRFGRPLNQGDFGQLVENFFGFDSGGLIGLELRFGVRRGTQAVVHRTSDRTIQFSGLHEVIAQSDRRPLGLTLLVSVEGLDNFREHYSPAIGVLLSREIGTRAALYMEPIWVHDASLVPDVDGDALVLGIGGRVRVSRTVNLVAEAAPRLRRWSQGTAHVSVGIERRAGGHAFQLNVSNGLGTTYGQVARGGPRRGDWYIGFNISRKFY